MQATSSSYSSLHCIDTMRCNMVAHCFNAYIRKIFIFFSFFSFAPPDLRVAHACHYTNLCPHLSQKHARTHTHAHTHTHTHMHTERIMQAFTLELKHCDSALWLTHIIKSSHAFHEGEFFHIKIWMKPSGVFVTFMGSQNIVVVVIQCEGLLQFCSNFLH